VIIESAKLLRVGVGVKTNGGVGARIRRNYSHFPAEPEILDYTFLTLLRAELGKRRESSFGG